MRFYIYIFLIITGIEASCVFLGKVLEVAGSNIDVKVVNIGLEFILFYFILIFLIFFLFYFEFFSFYLLDLGEEV